MQMPEFDGISLARELISRNDRVIIFVMTNYDEYMDSAMDLRVLRFFSKPIETKRMTDALNKAVKQYNESHLSIYVTIGGKTVKLIVNDIKYITYEGRKTVIYTKSGTYRLNEKFKIVTQKIPNTFFCLVHKAFFVNMMYITKYEYTQLYIGNSRIPIATRRQSYFHKMWFDYIRNLN